MRISHKYKFIFLATPRTGSSTVRNVLNQYSDIQSVHISEVNEANPFYHHISALELKEIFEQKGWNWDEYFKFCFVRNPFDRVASLYHHKKRKDAFADLSFSDYVARIDTTTRLPTSMDSFLNDSDGKLLCDKILKFEKMGVELPEILSKFGIDIDSSQIPHLNASENRFKYREYYDERLKKDVQDLYHYEFENFDYSF